jgi:flavin reductase (DIM6/NTAB) family NADH-FMN oxidoreductase RutF
MLERRHSRASTGFVDPSTFLSVMGSLATGVTIVATLTDDSQPVGMTCSATCSVSKDPPLLLVCIHRDSRVLRSILDSGMFTVNVLREGRQHLSGVFASPAARDRFASVSWQPGARTGLPCLPADSVAHAECLVDSVIDAGDHAVLIGGVLAGQVTEEPASPLMYWRREYGSWHTADPLPLARSSSARLDGPVHYGREPERVLATAFPRDDG